MSLQDAINRYHFYRPDIGTASAHYTEIEAHFYYLGEQVRLCTETQDQNGQNIPRADNICQRIFRRFILAFKY